MNLCSMDNKKVILRLALFLCFFASFPASSELLPEDSCRYLIDLKDYPKESCGQFDTTRQTADFAEASKNAADRKKAVLLLAEKLDGAKDPVQIKKILADPDFRLNPELNKRTFSAWLSPRQAERLYDKLKLEAGSGKPADERFKSVNADVDALKTSLKSAEQLARIADGSRIRPASFEEPAAAHADREFSARSAAAASAPRAEGASDLKIAPPPAPIAAAANQPARYSHDARPSWDDTLDRKTSPCMDFYQFACGTWIKNHSGNWSRIEEVQARLASKLRQILQEASRQGKTPEMRKLGDFYNACMDQKSLDAQGLAAIKPELERINALSSKSEFAGMVAHLHYFGVNALFSFRVIPDYKNVERQIAAIDEGGRTLPREYYLSDQFSEELAEFEAHIKFVLMLAGDSPKTASAGTKAVMRIETALAAASSPPTSRRDPSNRHNKTTFESLSAHQTAFHWKQYITALGIPPATEVNVGSPGFFQKTTPLLENAPLEEWKAYLRWRLIHTKSHLLPEPFQEQNFEFFDKVIFGETERAQRWRHCVADAEENLGGILGRAYVERHFSAGDKDRVARMAQNIKETFETEIAGLDWLSPETKQQALKKIRALSINVGHPEKWDNYDKLQIRKDDALGNDLRVSAFYFRRMLAGIGKPRGKDSFDLPATIINANYVWDRNSINLPAGILQPPFFGRNMDTAEIFGAIGEVIGHELTHSIDDQGRQFDAQGNLNDWWAPQDAKNFNNRAQCLEKQYSELDAANGIKTDGKLTMGENIADNGGLRLAYKAFQKSSERTGISDEFTPDQRFFLSFAQTSCASKTDQSSRLHSKNSVHPAKKNRVNGPVSNMPEFKKAFNCPDRSPMVRENACRVW